MENKQVILVKMNNRHLLSLIIMMLGLFLSVGAQAQSKYVNIEWEQLMPFEDLDILLNPPEFLSGIEDQASNDNMSTLDQASPTDAEAKKYQQALESTRVVETFNNKAIRLPGFIVPIETNEKKRVTQFFIVPYFGACLHMPPPPPNQIIYATSEKGIELTSLYDAFWFEGVLKIDTTDTMVGTSAYSMNPDKIYPYED
ncbi:DUF3299 domain-containing protein [Colwellia sp. UCD-KL20]|uniref:DUF3299 domain-containing protein n=1 Tax=Colwellia sp. UCD-KL20 TaxID=1917165 RepID=UPI00256FFA58|nr:DUF3299 domain-containing protein [Colwellia sp. UCD-KL20]